MEYIKTGNIISGVFRDFSIDTSDKAGSKWGVACLKDGKIEHCYNCKHYVQHYEAMQASVHEKRERLAEETAKVRVALGMYDK